MRTVPFGVANLVAVVAIAGSTLTAVGSGRHTDFATQATKLEQRWIEMQADGVAPAALAPLQTALRTSGYQAPWWSPSWWNDPGASFMRGLEARTQSTWREAVAGARMHAASVLLSWDLTVERDAGMLPAATVALSSTWVSRIASATTPASIETVSVALVSATASAARAWLERSGVLVDAIPANLRQLLLSADQAAAEHIPGSSGFLASYRQFAQADAIRSGTPARATLGLRVASLLASVTAALRTNACGHAVPSGKAIVINLTLQEVVFYQDGCALEAAPVTSGRRNERTPTGTFHVFHKNAPVLFTSWAPRGSPFWYRPERANYALEFTVVRAGIFLHDAPWEPTGAYGPGSDNSADASHGCVHAPTSVMRWAFSWASIGTPVIVTV